MVKEGSSDYKKVRKRWFFKEHLTMFLCGTKSGSSMASLEEPFEAPLFLRVYIFSDRVTETILLNLNLSLQFGILWSHR